MSRRHFTVLLTLTVAIAVIAPATSEARSSSIKRGKWKATVTYQKKSGSGIYTMYKRLRVTIKRGRSTIVRRRPPTVAFRDHLVSAGRPKWKVANLDADASPEFILAWMNGCAHSCTRANAFGVGAPRSSTVPIHLPDGFFVEDVDGNGVAELVAGDSRFSYQFASYASSGYPILINSLAGGSVVDVTRNFPARIEADAAELLERWNNGAKWSDGGGVALAYAADLCRLGRRAEAMVFLDDAENSTSVPLVDNLDYGYDPEYAEQAEAFLVSVGYC
jgi:hypothetical protein